MHKVILEGTLSMTIKLFIYMENNQYLSYYYSFKARSNIRLVQLKPAAATNGPLKTHMKQTFSQPGSKQNDLKNAVFQGFIKVLHFHCTQFCTMMYKVHPDVYHFFIEGL